jgi:hypothetical protein|tara:strand:+ start:427 stop:699 length:273 start_codon:yes stop_codon:yes gene_type:complete
MEKVSLGIRWIFAFIFIMIGMYLLQPYGVLLAGFFMTGWGFFLFYTTLPKSEPLDWSKIGRNHDQMVNKLKFDQMSRRIDEVEKVSYSNI